MLCQAVHLGQSRPFAARVCQPSRAVRVSARASRGTRPEYIPNRIDDPNYVRIFDTTLRDGEQSPGATLTSKEKMEIARQLVKLGRWRRGEGSGRGGLLLFGWGAMGGHA